MTKDILTTENIHLNVAFEEKEAAIRYTGEILVKEGYVDSAYIDKMLEREAMTSTYMGNNIAIPHGTDDSKSQVLHTGISIVTVPEGIDFGDGNIVKVLIGIAGKGDEHLEVLSNIAIVCSEQSNVDKLIQATTKEEIIQLFAEVN